MKTRLACTLLVGALLASAAEVTIPIEKYELKNGLRVILSQDNADAGRDGLYDLRRRLRGPRRKAARGLRTCSST